MLQPPLQEPRDAGTRAGVRASRPAEYRRVASACTVPRLRMLRPCLAAACRWRPPRTSGPARGQEGLAGATQRVPASLCLLWWAASAARRARPWLAAHSCHAGPHGRARAPSPRALRVLLVVGRLPVILPGQQVDLGRHTFPYRHFIQPEGTNVMQGHGLQMGRVRIFLPRHPMPVLPVGVARSSRPPVPPAPAGSSAANSHNSAPKM